MDFQTIQSNVANWINRDDLSTIIPTVINLVQLQIERKYHFKYRETTQVWPANTLTKLSLPSNYDIMTYCFVTDTNGKMIPLQKMPARSAWAKYPSISQYTARPELCAVDNGWSTLIIRPTPNQAYDITMEYYSKSPSLINPNDTNWLTDNAWDVLIYGALLELQPYLFDANFVQLWQQKYNDAVAAIQISQTEEQFAGSAQTAQYFGPSHTYMDII